MADGKVRRTLSRVSRAAQRNGNAVQHNAGIPASESGTGAVADRSADANDRNPDEQPVSAQRNSVNVVEVEPGQLTEFIERDTASSGTDSDSGTRRRRRTEPGTRRKRKETPQDIGDLFTLAHTWGSVFLRCPELMLDEDGSEAKKVNDAYQKFCEHHDPLPALTAKRMSEINLIVALAMVEVPRIMAIAKRKKEEVTQRSTQAGAIPINAKVAH